MKLIDEKGRIGGKLSLIDLALLLLILVIAVGAFLRFSDREQPVVMVAETPVRYTLEVAGVRDWTRNNIQVGDALFRLNNYVGTVTSVTATPHRVLSPEGGAWWGEVPDRYTLIIEVEGTASVIDGRILVARTVPLHVTNLGSIFTTRYAETSATVREIVLYDE